LVEPELEEAPPESAEPAATKVGTKGKPAKKGNLTRTDSVGNQ
jgi:hypothetical protein